MMPVTRVPSSSLTSLARTTTKIPSKIPGKSVVGPGGFHHVTPVPLTHTTLPRFASTAARKQLSLSHVGAGVALFGFGGLMTYALTTSSGDYASMSSYGRTVQSNIRSTYMYVAGGLASTAIMAGAMFQQGFHYKIARYNPWLVLGVSLVGTIGAMTATQMIPYENTIPKHLAWLAFNGCIAASMVPLGVVGSSILLKAALGTGVMVGGLSLVAFANPDRTFLKMSGPLTIGLGTMLAASIGTMVFPASAILHNFVLYGGMGLFGLLLLHDTQRMIERSERFDSFAFDPINSSIGIYMDTIQIFWRMVAMLSGGNRRK